jgi:hypothetical protein
MKIRLLVVTALVLLLSSVGLNQKNVTDLKPAHAIALEQFLSRNKNYGFLSEKVLDAEYLKDMRKYFKNLRPYYNVADYNRDGALDFSLILSRKGQPKDNGEGMAETHRYDHPMAIVIFNGNRQGKYTKAFQEDIEAPLACFLNTDRDGKKLELYFGVFQSDADTRIFTPVGKGYNIEYPDTP